MSPLGQDVEEVQSALTGGAVRVDCGGPAVGAFAADTNFSGGATLTRTVPIDLSGVTNPGPLALYQSQRYNNMTYTFSGFTAGSSNDVRLHFADTKWTAANQRLFNVTINGTQVLSNFDVIATAGAANKAVTRSFTVAANGSGAYVIQFVGTKDAAMVSGIEVGSQVVGAFTHVNCGGPATGAFVADQGFTGGSTVTRANTINLTGVVNPAPAAVYQSQRYGAMSYTFPGFAAGSVNNVRLHFADTHWTATNARLFNVAINGAPVLTSFDVVAAAGGGNKAVVKDFRVAANAAGSYAIQFTAVKDDPTISGIEIVPLCSSVTLSVAPAGATPTSKVKLTGAATCVAGVQPEYHFAFRDPSSADNSWHDVTPTFGGAVVTWDTNWRSTTPMGTTLQLEVLARAVNNANGGETSALATLVLTSASQVGASAGCTSASACDDGVVSTVDTCTAGHCGVEPNAHGAQTVTSYAPPPTTPSMTPVDPTKPVSITVGVPMRTPVPLQPLEARVDALSDPQSPLYRHFLSASELAAYLPAATDTNMVVAWAQQNQLTATLTPGTPVVNVSGTAAQIQKALYVHLVTGPRPDGTPFFGPDRLPSLDLALTLLGVSGLDNYAPPKPAFLGGSGPDVFGTNMFNSSDLRRAYLGGTNSACSGLTGAGQKIGLLACAGFNPSDITTFQMETGLTTAPPVQVILADNNVPCAGAGCGPGQSIPFLHHDNDETSLDIETSMAMAPGAQIFVFEDVGCNSDAIFAKMLANPQIRQLSSSWGIGTSAITPSLLTIMAAQGQTIFEASGDSGSYDNSLAAPMMCVPNTGVLPPYMTMVGGTDLSMTGPGGTYATEAIYTGSGGGVLTSMPIPSWQVGLNPNNHEVSTTHRNAPDVSLPGTTVYMRFTQCQGLRVGDPIVPERCVGTMVCGLGTPNPVTGMALTYLLSCGASDFTSQPYEGIGTSVSSPMWAGYMALINQNNANLGVPSVGWANPTFYAIGKDPVQYAADFNDVVDLVDTQTTDCLHTSHQTVTGYDLVTGLGSPRCPLIARMATTTPSLSLTAVPTATGLNTAPVSVQGTGTGFTPGGRVQFTVAGVPTTGGATIPEYTLTVSPTASVQGSITYSIAADALPTAVFCQAGQRGQLVTITAHDLKSKEVVPTSNVFVSATISSDFFCRSSLGLTINPTATGTTLSPVWLRGTGTNFTGGGAVDFTISGIPTVGGTLPPSSLGDDVTADAQGNITYSISGDLPPAIVCQPNQQNQLVTLTAHDLAAGGATGSATFSSNFFCSNLLTFPPDTNLARNKTVFVHSTLPGFPGSQAVDGNTSTYWASQDTLGQDWITVDLGQTRTIHRLLLLWGATRFATDYQLQISDDNATWRNVVTATNQRGGTNDWPGLPPATGRYVRALLTASWNVQFGGYSLYELEVWGEAGF